MDNQDQDPQSIAPELKHPSPPADYYLHTIDRMEPDIAFIDASAGWASIAISLKRIADCMERQEARVNQPAPVIYVDAGHGGGRGGPASSVV